MNLNYECHITVPRVDASVAEQAAEALHWKFSKIEGDPVLGKETFAYLTTHDSDLLRLRERMDKASAWMRSRGAAVLREKIELIVYDTKAKA